MEQPVGSLRGVGAQREMQLGKMGIHTVQDLLLHYPRGYVDLSHPYEIQSAPLGQPCAVLAHVVKKMGETRLRGGIKLYKAVAEDASGSMELTFFNNRYAVDNLAYDVPYLFYGRVEGGLLHRTMSAPMVYPVRPDRPFIPIYRLTAGLSGRVMAGLVDQALQRAPALPEVLPEPVREQFGLWEVNRAIRAIHHPASQEEARQARRRMIFEELFTLAVGLGTLKHRAHTCAAAALEPHDLQPFYDALPFSPTDAQRRAIRELTEDMCRPIPANRLVQGDVGSGKTMVAAAGAWFAWRSGAQTALMAPTELLAQQHYESLQQLLGDMGMRVALLTGSSTPAHKRQIREGLAAGEIDLCIGTHALLTQGVEFRNLGLVITDEQHRFGVAQRTLLQQKGAHAHTLVMSATPIPRTLALMVYGELDLSVIDQMPPGRQPVKTYKISSPKRERAFAFMRGHLDRGRQAYIVCPLVEGVSEAGLHAAASYVEELSQKYFAAYRLGLLHGRMKAADKERVMSAFKRGEIQLLVSTTVVEVGVDVPNAVIMLVENAERFGLSQLHQLRGRVGRGTEQSYCILVSDSRSPDTLDRLQMLCRSNSGFEIAEYDLKTRGPGNFLGQEQHGLPQMRIADLSTDLQEVEQAQLAAQQLLQQDPQISAPEHAPLRKAVDRLIHAVGTRPN